MQSHTICALKFQLSHKVSVLYNDVYKEDFPEGMVTLGERSEML